LASLEFNQIRRDIWEINAYGGEGEGYTSRLHEGRGLTPLYDDFRIVGGLFCKDSSGVPTVGNNRK